MKMVPIPFWLMVPGRLLAGLVVVREDALAARCGSSDEERGPILLWLDPVGGGTGEGVRG